MSTIPPPLPPPQPVPKRGLSGCAIAAIVVGALFLLGVVAVGVGGYIFVQKAGGRGGIAKAAIGMANPDYDVIDIDDQEKTITVRHKKTGKTATFPMSHMKDGHVDPSDMGMTRDEAEGTGAAPEWVKYPNGKQMTAAQLMGITTIMYRTDDSAEEVLAHYNSVLKEKGIRATTQQANVIMVNDDKSTLQISTSAGGTKGATLITVVYRAK